MISNVIFSWNIEYTDCKNLKELCLFDDGSICYHSEKNGYITSIKNANPNEFYLALKKLIKTKTIHSDLRIIEWILDNCSITIFNDCRILHKENIETKNCCDSIIFTYMENEDINKFYKKLESIYK